MELIDNLSSVIRYPTYLTLFWVLLKIGIDTFNITGIERKLMADSENLVAFFSQISLVSILVTVIISLGIVFPNNNISLDDLDKLLAVFLVNLIFVLIIVTVVSFIVFFLIYYFKIQVNYYIKEPFRKWEIIRRIDKEKILLRSDHHLKIVNIDYVINKEISSIIDESKVVNNPFLYLDNKVSIIIKAASIIILIIVYIFSFLGQVLMGILIFALIYMLILHYIVAHYNKIILEKWNEIKNK